MNATLPREASAREAAAAIVEEFGLFGDWSERYQYLIDLGRKLPDLAAAEKNAMYKVSGCQSSVWLVPGGDAARMTFRAISDSAIVSGLIALLLRVYADRPAAEILTTDADFIDAIGLSRHLSPTRTNGLAAMLQTIRA
ncbi:MAG: SufE family protein, partial [Xanthomonadaceae bacterium]|nr:SufE family protein [Xanthomonadaceae bacterium]